MSDSNSISQARLRDLFDYADGRLVWKKPTGRRTAVGSRAGWKNSTGYFRVNIDGGSYSLHRLVWMWHFGSCKGAEIDHIDGDKSNNAIENLRTATRAENCRNRGKLKPKTSAIKGVSKRHDASTWRARITVNGVVHDLGSYKTEEQAIQARIAAQPLHGNFARL